MQWWLLTLELKGNGPERVVEGPTKETRQNGHVWCGWGL